MPFSTATALPEPAATSVGLASASTLPQANAAQGAAGPLAPERWAPIATALRGLEPAQLWWVSGYAAGLAQVDGVPAPAPEAPATAARLTIVYGSQTGNARRVAELLHARAEAAGLRPQLLRADSITLHALAATRLLYLVISTHGDGDPPDDATALVEGLHSRRAPRLDAVSFAVFALGDSSYPKFCEVGRRLDARLAELGGTRLIACAEADLDVDRAAEDWLPRALEHVQTVVGADAATPAVTPLRAVTAPPRWSRAQPFAAELLCSQRITAGDCEREVRHLEIALSGAGFTYEPGDAIGVRHRNPPALVQAVLAAARLDADAPVDDAGRQQPLAEALAGHELTRLSRPLLAAHAARARAPALDALLADAGLPAWLRAHQLLDALQQWPAHWDAGELYDALPASVPRLYSIASSRAAVGDEAHLAVAVLRQGSGAALRLGAASNHLASLQEGASVDVYLEPNERFRLPADDDRDLIMIGPGTGVAPFRGFLQQRVAAGVRGRHWLLFGARHLRRDFLYQLEWQQALARGTLHRLDVAFSRDRPGRAYVQQRLHEHARTLYDWLQGGAHLYVCGSLAMGQDVHEALVEILGHQRGGRDAGEAWLKQLASERRYARDLY